MADVEIRTEGLVLEIERSIDAPRAIVWRCWTEPGLLKQWYCPKPWSVPVAAIDLRPGGRMDVVMAGPDGERMEIKGVLLEIDAGRRLTFTEEAADGSGPKAGAFMTGSVELSDTPSGGTRMVWGARHTNQADKEKHLAMGFEAGWPAAAQQLEDLARSLAGEKSSSATAAAAGRKVRTCLFLKDAEAAANFYVSLMPDSQIESVVRPDPNGPALVVEFTVGGLPMMTLAGNPDPVPSHISSVSVLTEDQAETDALWAKLLTDGGEAGRCGWLKDRFGAHWQVVPAALPRLMQSGDAAAAGRVQQALMAMAKIDIAQLEAAHRGTSHA